MVLIFGPPANTPQFGFKGDWFFWSRIVVEGSLNGIELVLVSCSGWLLSLSSRHVSFQLHKLGVRISYRWLVMNHLRSVRKGVTVVLRARELYKFFTYYIGRTPVWRKRMCFYTFSWLSSTDLWVTLTSGLHRGGLVKIKASSVGKDHSSPLVALNANNVNNHDGDSGKSYFWGLLREG